MDRKREYTVFNSKEKKVSENPLDNEDELVVYLFKEEHRYYISKFEVKYRNEKPDIEEAHMMPTVSIPTRPVLYRRKKWAIESFEETVTHYVKKGINVKVLEDDEDINKWGGLNRYLKFASIPVSKKDLQFREFNRNTVIYCELVISVVADVPFDDSFE